MDLTYEELVGEMHNRRLIELSSSLDLAVRDEVEVLLKGANRRTGKAERTAEQDAKDYYTTEINLFLNAPGSRLTPRQILSSRSLPTAWAIAHELLAARFESKCPECGEPLTKLADMCPIFDPNEKTWGNCARYLCTGPQPHPVLVQNSIMQKTE